MSRSAVGKVRGGGGGYGSRLGSAWFLMAEFHPGLLDEKWTLHCPLEMTAINFFAPFPAPHLIAQGQVRSALGVSPPTTDAMHLRPSDSCPKLLVTLIDELVFIDGNLKIFYPSSSLLSFSASPPRLPTVIGRAIEISSPLLAPRVLLNSRRILHPSSPLPPFDLKRLLASPPVMRQRRSLAPSRSLPSTSDCNRHVLAQLHDPMLFSSVSKLLNHQVGLGTSSRPL